MSADIQFDHTGFITPSVERSIDFWTNVMGFEARPVVERRGPWVASFTGVAGGAIRIVHMFGLGTHIEFIEFLAPTRAPEDLPVNQPATGHVCLRVPDLDAMVKRVLAVGGSLAGQITTITEGAAAGVRGLYLRDPNGVLIELLEKQA
jgi:catechol 2,3-dioxygenase-like lactoylglutathione lyase family enzyme